MSPMAVDVLTGVLRPLHSRAWDVQVDTAGLERLRELNRTHPLVFLPSHRSYADPLLLADVLAEHDFPRNHVLGGDNLRVLAGRAAGQARRDRVHPAQLRRRRGLQARRAASTSASCWPSGSTWSGTWRAAARAPASCARRATGCCANVAEAVERGRVDDVYLVPVSITYDQLREVSAMAAEQGGAAEEGRGPGLAGHATRGRSCTPIGTGVRPVRRADLAARRRWRPAPDPTAIRTRARLALQKVAFEVAVGINWVTPVVATALVTLALLGVRDRALTLGQVRRVLEPVRGLPRPSGT